MAQTYPGEEDHIEHFYNVLKAFKDKRYICVDNKPLFLIYDPFDIPDVKKFISLWNSLAVQNGLKGIHFVGIASNLSGFYPNENKKKKYYLVSAAESSESRYNQILDLGFDAVNSKGLFRAELIVKGRYFKLIHNTIKLLFGGCFIDKYKYGRIIENLYVKEDSWENVYPTIIPNWDRSPRSGRLAPIYYGSTPDLFKKSVESVIKIIKEKSDDHKILFLMSWNEWAEGNYVEPDLVYGKGYLEKLKETILK